MLSFQGGNLRARITGDTAPIRLRYTDAVGEPIEGGIEDYEFALTVDPNASPTSEATNLFTRAGTIVDADTCDIEFALSQEEADLLVPLDGNAAYHAWIAVTSPSGRVETVRMRLPVAGGSGGNTMSITGPGGAALTEGQILTGSDVRALVVENGVVRLTYEEAVPSAIEQGGALHLFRKVDGAWVRALSQQYGDWTFFAAPFQSDADEIEVIEASADAVEFVMRWNDHRLDVAYLNNLGLVYLTYAGLLIYRQSASNPNWDYLKFTRFQKVVRLERDADGYYVGYHSEPRIGPSDYLLRTGAHMNNNLSFGEREFGTGSGSVVAFSSNGRTGHFPGWGQRAIWAAAEVGAGGAIANHAMWMGHDDPVDPTFNAAYYIATQFAGYPAEQTSGPFWMADIYSGGTMARFVVTLRRKQTAVWQFGAQQGVMLIHLMNEDNDARGVPDRFQAYMGAFAYAADATAGPLSGYTGSIAYANEPTAGLRATVEARAVAVTAAWPR